MATLPAVFVTRNDFPKEGIELLQTCCKVETWDQPGTIPRKELLKKIAGKDALFCSVKEKINDELLSAAGPKLKVIGTYSVGYDHVDIQVCKKRALAVGYTPDVLTDACAEHTVALLLATCRRLPEALSQVTNGGWNDLSWSPLWMCGKLIAGSTIGIVGFGRIGYGVAERLKSFKVKKIVYSGNSEKPKAKSVGAEKVAFEDLLSQSDFVICCAPLTSATHHLFNLDTFRRMKSSAIFVNTSRGGLVNHEDLHTALSSGLIYAAGLDVTDPEPLPPDHKLTELKNCVLLPHIASATVETRTAMSLLTAQNIIAGLEGRPLPAPLF